MSDVKQVGGFIQLFWKPNRSSFIYLYFLSMMWEWAKYQINHFFLFFFSFCSKKKEDIIKWI